MQLKSAFLPPLVVLVLFFSSCGTREQGRGHLDSLTNQLTTNRIQLPNGWSLSPIGTTLALGDFPLNLVVSSAGKFMAVTNNGQGTQSISLIDPTSKKILHEIEIKKSWYGLAFNRAETLLYASGGNDNMIVMYDITDSRLKKVDSIILGQPWPVKISPTGLAIDDEGGRLFIATKEDSSLYVADLTTKESVKLSLGHEAYACVLSPDRKVLYVSLWGGDKVAVVDPERLQIKATIDVGSNPNDMTLTKDGKFLYVANGNDNSVSVIETSSQKVIEVFSSALYPNSPAGSTTNAVALSEDEDLLYIANADNNCLAVFDVEKPGSSKSLGFIPTGWYPTSVKVWKNNIWIANGKGATSLANPKGPNPYLRHSDTTQYIGALFKGTLSIVPEPDQQELSIFSSAAYKNSPYNKEIEKMAEGEEGNPIPRKLGTQSPIKHVFYIVKENRTYDQTGVTQFSWDGITFFPLGHFLDFFIIRTILICRA